MMRRLSALAVLLTMAPLSTAADSEEPPSESPVTKAEAKMLLAPFTRDDALGAQNAWSRSLGTPVEITNSIGMKLALIPPGEFLMGSTAADIEKVLKAYPHDPFKWFILAEKPQHRVRITKPFYLGVYEVTQTEYERVMHRNPSAFSKRGEHKQDVGGLDTTYFPVECVSWEDAVEFCRRLGAMPEERQAGRVYRLPTEAEWEYACRAGTATPFHFGSELNGREANCDGDYPYGTTERGPSLERPTTVGSYAASAFGLYDMHGNVGEWCQDSYGEDYYESSPIDDPLGPEGSPQVFWGPRRKRGVEPVYRGSLRIFRGGSWSGSARYCRSALRLLNGPADRAYYMGFRVAAVPPGK